MDSLVLTIVSIPTVALLLSNATLALFAFIAILPLDSIAIGDVGGIPKLVGIVATVAFLITWAIRKKPIHWDRSLNIYLLFVFVGLLSFFWSSNPDLTIRAFSTYLLALMIPFLMLNVCEDKHTLGIMMIALAVAGMITVCSGLIDLVQVLGTRERVAGIVENANSYALWCVISFPGLYWLWMKWKNWLSRLLLVAVFAGSLFTTLYSLSRGGYISLLVFALSIVLLSRVRLRILVLVALIGILIFWFWPEEQTTRFESLLSGQEIRLELLWPMGIEAFLSSPMVGYGLGTSSWVLGSIYGGYGGGDISVHSAPLAIAIELGILGLLPYLLYIISILLQAFRLLKYLRVAQSELYPLQIAMIAAFIALLFTWVKGGGMEYSKTLFLLTGFLLVINQVAKSQIAHVCQVPVLEISIQQSRLQP